MKPAAANIVSGLGKALIIVGSLTLLFAAFQLWGTGLQEANAQQNLETQFIERLVEVEDTPADTSELRELPSNELPAPGDPIAIIEIESIGVKKTVVEGVTRDVLRSGPGRYPQTSFPGQPGNSAIAGHRTTYGSPFFDLDKVQPGDIIKVTTLQGEFFYEIEGHSNGDEELGYKVVLPTQGEVLLDRPGVDSITLTACHPKYSAAERLIVTATLTSKPAPKTEFVTEAVEVPIEDSDEALAESLGWQPQELQGTILWAMALFALGFIVSTIANRWKLITTYAIGALPLLALTFMFFTQLERLLPAV